MYIYDSQKSIHIYIYLYIVYTIYTHLSIYLSIYLLIYLSICLYIYLSERKISKECSIFCTSEYIYRMFLYMNKCLRIHTLWIYSWSTLENTDENRIFFVRSPHHKHLGKAQHLVLWALWWYQLFSNR